MVVVAHGATTARRTSHISIRIRRLSRCSGRRLDGFGGVGWGGVITYRAQVARMPAFVWFRVPRRPNLGTFIFPSVRHRILLITTGLPKAPRL